MADNILLPNYNYTYDGQLAMELLIDPAVEAPDITSLFTVMRGIKYKRQLSIVEQLGKMVKGAQGCNPAVTTEPVNIFNRTIETCEHEFILHQCRDAFNSTLLMEFTTSGARSYDLTMNGNTLGQVINKLVTDNLQREIFRTLSFGDTDNGVNDYYNVCDGLWKRLFDGAASYEVTAVNDNISSLSASDTIGYFRALYEGADSLLRQIPQNQKKFYTTANVYDALLTYYEGNANSGGFVGREEDGVMRLRYRGIDIIPFEAWDSWISADNLGTNVRILYTTPRNHIIGIDAPVYQGVWDFWYDQNTRKNKIDGNYRMGYNYVHNKLQAISYGNV